MVVMKGPCWLLVLVVLVVVGGCGEVKPSIDAPPVADPTLTVMVSGSGAVTSTPAGIDCPGTCSAAFPVGTSVTLAATATSPTIFTGWTSGCTPSRRDCTITVDADTAVAAGFATQGSKRWLMTAGAPSANANGRSVVANRGHLATAGQTNLPMMVGGKPATGGMFVARLDPATGQAAWLVNVANATLLEAAVDTDGNVIVSGHFSGMINLGTGNVASNASSTDIFIVKYAADDGAHVWSKVIGGTFFDFATAMTLGANGDVIVGGSFSRTVDFGNGPRTSTGGDVDDVYVARYAAATGQHVWSTTFGNADIEQVYGLAVDPAGSISAAGTFTGNLSVGPAFLQAGTTSDGMLVKLDGASGNVLFAKDLGGTGGDSASRIGVDGDGNIFVGGRFTPPMDLGGGALTIGPSFVAKFTAGGAHVWSRGVDADVERVVIDSFGQVVLGGLFRGSTDLGNGVMLPAAGAFDAFVAKLDADGTTLWGKRFGGTGNDGATGVGIDALDRIYVSGSFAGVADFDGETPTAAGATDVFVLGLEP